MMETQNPSPKMMSGAAKQALAAWLARAPGSEDLIGGGSGGGPTFINGFERSNWGAKFE
jgi:hypothetical protein